MGGKGLFLFIVSGTLFAGHRGSCAVAPTHCRQRAFWESRSGVLPRLPPRAISWMPNRSICRSYCLAYIRAQTRSGSMSELGPFADFKLAILMRSRHRSEYYLDRLLISGVRHSYQDTFEKRAVTTALDIQPIEHHSAHTDFDQPQLDDFIPCSPRALLSRQAIVSTRNWCLGQVSVQSHS